MMHRSLASEFLSLLQFLNISNEEVKTADNYFTEITHRTLGLTKESNWVVVRLSRWVPKATRGIRSTSLVHIIPLATLRFMMSLWPRACYILTQFWAVRSTAGARLVANTRLFPRQRQWVIRPYSGTSSLLGSCLFETTISLLPNEIEHSYERAQDMLDIEERNFRILVDKMAHYPLRLRWMARHCVLEPLEHLFHTLNVNFLMIDRCYSG
jgi:hypothetical protein